MDTSIHCLEAECSQEDFLWTTAGSLGALFRISPCLKESAPPDFDWSETGFEKDVVQKWTCGERYHNLNNTQFLLTQKYKCQPFKSL